MSSLYLYSQVYGSVLLRDEVHKWLRVVHCVQCLKTVGWKRATLDSSKRRCDNCFTCFLTLLLAVNDDHYRKPGMKPSIFVLLDFDLPESAQPVSRRVKICRDYPLTHSDLELDWPCRSVRGDESMDRTLQ